MPKTRIDLWNEVRAAMRGKELVIVKVEGRMSAEGAISAGVDPVDFLGNRPANDFVDQIIGSVQVPRAEARRLGWAEGIASLIRGRAAATSTAAVEAEPSQTPSREARRQARERRGKSERANKARRATRRAKQGDKGASKAGARRHE